MKQNIGRNDPCSCGSNIKYKKCCLIKNTQGAKTEFKPKYQFNPGSYGDTGNFMPSIACEKLVESGAWEYHFVLVNPNKVLIEQDKAVELAEEDLAKARKIKNDNSSDSEFAIALKTMGYFSVDGFNIVSESKYQA